MKSNLEKASEILTFISNIANECRRQNENWNLRRPTSYVLKVSGERYQVIFIGECKYAAYVYEKNATNNIYKYICTLSDYSNDNLRKKCPQDFINAISNSEKELILIFLETLRIKLEKKRKYTSNPFYKEKIDKIVQLKNKFSGKGTLD